MPPGTGYFCFLCQSDLKEPTTYPSTLVKLKNNFERILACYEKVIDNIRQPNELEELPNSIFTVDIVGVAPALIAILQT